MFPAACSSLVLPRAVGVGTDFGDGAPTGTHACVARITALVSFRRFAARFSFRLPRRPLRDGEGGAVLSRGLRCLFCEEGIDPSESPSPSAERYDQRSGPSGHGKPSEINPRTRALRRVAPPPMLSLHLELLSSNVASSLKRVCSRSKSRLPHVVEFPQCGIRVRQMMNWIFFRTEVSTKCLVGSSQICKSG